MDTRHRRGNQPPLASQVERKTERSAAGAPDVEIIELTKVPRRSGRSNMAAAIAILSSLTVLATAAYVLPKPGPESSVAPAVSGAASGVAVASVKPTLRSPSPSPTRGQVTPPPPTAAPPPTPAPGEWTSSIVAPGEQMYPQGLWAVDGRFLVMSQGGQTDLDASTWRFHSSVDGRQWLVQGAPTVVGAFSGGTVVDGRLWFGARLTGLNDTDSRWELASTLDGGSWDVLAQMQGWEMGHGMGSLAHIGDTWVATRYWEGTDETSVELVWSPDGAKWTVASIPVDPVEIGPQGGWIWFRQLARIGDTILISGGLGNYERTVQFVLSSRDGRTWSRYDLPSRTNLSIVGLACNAERCVMPALGFGDTEVVARSIFVSTDGRSWRETALDLPQSTESAGFEHVVATPTGFLAIGITSGTAWVSPDGVQWRAEQVMPAERSTLLGYLVVNGELAGGFGQTDGEASPPFWHGEVPATAG